MINPLILHKTIKIDSLYVQVPTAAKEAIVDSGKAYPTKICHRKVRLVIAPSSGRIPYM